MADHREYGVVTGPPTIFVLPDAQGGFGPCPPLLTEDEVIRYLRLDVDGTPNPKQTLKYYRDKGELTAIKVGKTNKYRVQDVDDFLARKSEKKKGRSALYAGSHRGLSRLKTRANGS
jgi:hypothetical protein